MMDVSKVSKEDGIACAHLLNALKIARFGDLTGGDLEAIVAAKRWLQVLAGKMAEQLKSPTEGSGGFKVKAVGPLPGATSPSVPLPSTPKKPSKQKNKK